MNTPAYFCFDNFGAEGEEVLPEHDIATAVQSVAFKTQQAGQVYDLSGRQQKAAGKGLNIVRQADGSVSKVLVK
jgi:hypothetical protein